MKAHNCEARDTTFKPIKIEFFIETQDELNAIIKARDSLARDEIDDACHTYEERDLYIEVLETIGNEVEK